MTRLVAIIRKHPELVMFGFALALFLGGLATFLTGAFTARPDTRANDQPTVQTSQTLGRIGPSDGEQIANYIQTRRALLEQRSSSQPKATSIAVVSFESYRKAAEVDAILKGRKLETIGFQFRIPLPGFKATDVRLDGRTIEKAIQSEIGPSKIATLTDELHELEKIIPTVTDADYKGVYKADAESHRKAIEILASDPSTVFAVVVKGSNSALAKLGSTPSVRLADLADDPRAAPATYLFVGLLPEDTERATFS